MQILLGSRVCNVACALNWPCCCALQVGFQVEPGFLVILTSLPKPKLGMQCCDLTRHSTAKEPSVRQLHCSLWCSGQACLEGADLRRTHLMPIG